MNIKDIEKIIKMLEGTDINEISIEHEGVKLQLKRGMQKEISLIQTPISSEMLGVGNINPELVKEVHVPNSIPAAGKAESAKKVAEEKEEYIEIKAPMVGTFYRAPSPESEPYVKVGDVLDNDTVVCIIETMKVMNEIQAEAQGKIVKILIENGKPVEFGQPMFLLEKI